MDLRIGGITLRVDLCIKRVNLRIEFGIKRLNVAFDAFELWSDEIFETVRGFLRSWFTPMKEQRASPF